MAMEITTPNAIILCALAFLMLIGILSPDDALEGFGFRSRIWTHFMYNLSD